VFTESRNAPTTRSSCDAAAALGAEKAAIAPLPRETVFVIDTSGSMLGTSIQQAKKRSSWPFHLTPRDRFNVVEFNSATRPMWPAALPATADNLTYARSGSRSFVQTGHRDGRALAFALDGRDTPDSCAR